MLDVTRGRAEVRAHAVCLVLFYLGCRSLVLLDAGQAGAIEWAFAIGLLIDVLALLALASVAMLPGVRARTARRFWVVLIYLLLVLECQFQRQTGSYFSATLAAYTLTQLADLWPVLRSTGFDFWLAMLIGTSVWAFGVPVIAGPRLLGLFARVLVGVIVLATTGVGVGAVVDRSGRKLSLFATLVGIPSHSETEASRPPYPYREPAVVGADGVPPPDVLIFSFESARAHSVPGFPGGGDKAHMPVLQALQDTARSFDAAYTTTSHTSKALVGILCGVEPMPVMQIVEARHGGLPVACLPRLLSRLGYRSLFLQSATEDFERRGGLIHNMGFDDALFREQIEQGYDRSGYFGVDERALIGPFDRWWITHADRPRLAVVLTSSTHHPYQVPGERTPRGLRAQARAYQRNLELSDAVLGELLRRVGPNALLIVTGDHGQAFGEHGLLQHDAVPYEEVLRVPLVLRLPNGAAGDTRDRALRTHLDILPTVLDATGARWQGQLPGRSLLQPEGHAELMTRCWWAASCAARITLREKWILFPPTASQAMFRLHDDPEERRDLAPSRDEIEREAMRDTIERHAASLRAFYAGRAIATP